MLMIRKFICTFHFQVRPQIRRRLLEQLTLLHDAVPLPDDDLLGDCVRRVVPAAHVPRRKRIGHRFRQPGERCDRQTGWPRRSHVGRPAETDETEEGVEGETTGGLFQAAQGRITKKAPAH
jgi:hypothetical protein